MINWPAEIDGKGGRAAAILFPSLQVGDFGWRVAARNKLPDNLVNSQ